MYYGRYYWSGYRLSFECTVNIVIFFLLLVVVNPVASASWLNLQHNHWCNAGVCVCVCVQALRKIGQDFLILMLCVTVFLSYLPEAGEYSSFFVYLRLVTCHLQHTDTQLARWLIAAKLF